MTRALRGEPRRRARVPALVAVAVAVATACTAGHSGPAGDQAATAESIVLAGARYVALGSSFASGLGLPPVVDEGCGRSAGNYPRIVADALQLELIDMSCFGARLENVEYAPQEAGDTRPAQLDAVTPDTAVVTLTIGGNDVGYTRVLGDQACSARAECPGISADEDGVRSELETIGDKLAVTLDTIAAKAPDATVLLVTYPQIVPSSGATCAMIALTAEQARFSATAGARLDRAFRDAATRTGARLVDSYRASEGHSACSADEPWVTGYLPHTPAGPAAFHPTASGMRAQAELVVAALRR